MTRSALARDEHSTGGDRDGYIECPISSSFICAKLMFKIQITRKVVMWLSFLASVKATKFFWCYRAFERSSHPHAIL